MTDDTPDQVPLPKKQAIRKAWADWAIGEKGWSLAHVKRVYKKFYLHHQEHDSKRPSEDAWEFAWRKWVNTERDPEPSKSFDKWTRRPYCQIDGCEHLGPFMRPGHQTGDPGYCWDHFYQAVLQDQPQEAKCFL